ncbi:MAG: PEGA domain-containing protein [Methanomicrobiales archaeon]|nr:PEGA domain-containing protein [Methanomicrobiales archaeon]
MKKREILLVVFLALLVGVVGAVGNISVSSVPAGATIFLNGTSTGQVTPATVEGVPAGSHTILLRLTNYQDNTQSVTVTDDTTSTVSQTLTAVVAAPTITTVDPATGINNGLVSGIVVTGTGFTSGTTTVSLYKSGQTNITMTSPVITSTTVTGGFQLNGALPGTWDVIVITDNGVATKTSGFTVVNASTVSTVTAVSPTSATTNTSVSTTFTGTGFGTSAKMRLARTGYNDILGTVSSNSATSLVGTFDLSNQVPGEWDVCVLYDGTNRVCGPHFTINAAAATLKNGTIYFSSTPSSAVVFVDSVKKGTTPFTLYNLTPGSYVVKIQKSSYLDWSERVTVTSGNETTVSAKLTYEVQETTAPTPEPTIIITTATMPPTRTKSTVATQTPWPTNTPTPESPLEVGVILAAVGMGILLVRKP